MPVYLVMGNVNKIPVYLVMLISHVWDR